MRFSMIIIVFIQISEADSQLSGAALNQASIEQPPVPPPPVPTQQNYYRAKEYDPEGVIDPLIKPTGYYFYFVGCKNIN